MCLCLQVCYLPMTLNVCCMLRVLQFADKCVNDFQSPHLLKLPVGSSHTVEAKYNAKSFQMCEICFLRILILISWGQISCKSKWYMEELPAGLCYGIAAAVHRLCLRGACLLHHVALFSSHLEIVVLPCSWSFSLLFFLPYEFGPVSFALSSQI